MKSIVYAIRFVICTAVLLSGICSFGLDSSKVEFKRSFALAPADHIVLDVTVPEGDVNIIYAHAGEVSVVATAQGDDSQPAPADFFEKSLKVERDGSHIQVQFTPDARQAKQAFKITYNIGVPNWIEINSTVGTGRQTVMGVMGPVKVTCGAGDIKVSYITTTLDAKTGSGNIKVIRVGTAARVETGLGNINLKDIGPGSVATVKKGTGRIEMDGISGSFTGATDAGELDVKGGVYGDWDLKSSSGNIRIGVAQEFKYEIDAMTHSGQLLVRNDDLEIAQDGNVKQCRQKVNGGGKLVRARSENGNIFID